MWLAMRGNFTLLTDETVNVIIVNLNKTKKIKRVGITHDVT